MRWKIACGWVLVTLLASCGLGQNESMLRGVLAEWDFTGWCADWGLRCDTISSNSSVMPERMKAVLAMKEALLKGPSQLTFSRKALTHPELGHALRGLGLHDALSALLTNLEESGFRALSAFDGRGYATLSFQAPGAFQAVSGLWMEPSEMVRVTPHSDGSLTFAGLNVADPTRVKRDSLGSWVPDADGSMIWRGPENTVSKIPQSFIPDMLGIDADKIPTVFDQKAVLGSLPSLVSVALSDPNRIELEQNFWSVLRAHLDSLVDDPNLRANVQALAESIDQLVATTVADSHGALAGTFKGAERMECRSDNAMIVLENHFGLQRLERLSGAAVRLTFYGTKVQAQIFGPIAPTFSLKRVDVYADKVVVHDIPIIGSYTIDLNAESSGLSGAFHCTHG